MVTIKKEKNPVVNTESGHGFYHPLCQTKSIKGPCARGGPDLKGMALKCTNLHKNNFPRWRRKIVIIMLKDFIIFELIMYNSLHLKD